VPALPLGLPMRVQLQVQGGVCVESTFTTAIGNDGGSFRARSD